MKRLFTAFIGILTLPIALLAASEQVADIEIEGMSCQFCVYSVQKNLTKVPGVEKATASIDNQKAYIIMEHGKQADLELLKKEISDSGFAPVKITIRIND